jgi:hypothetical protein
MDRLDLIQAMGEKMGIKKVPVNISSEEAEAITGLARNTICQYATLGYFPSFKFPNRNVYSLRDMCEYALKHYHPATGITASQMNCYQQHEVKRGRPKKKQKI